MPAVIPLWAVLIVLLVDGATFGFLTPPLLLEAGKTHPPWLIGLVGGVASAVGSMIQLRLLQWVLSGRHRWLARFAPRRQKLHDALERYKSASFLGLVLMRATPIPDLPIKLVAAAGGYPILRYGLAVWLGALPYYYLLAKAGQVFPIPRWVLITAVMVVAVVAVGERVVHFQRERE
jgi:membrane protein YqaA with SNARE-associated domain